jgi:hypothetical protein
MEDGGWRMEDGTVRDGTRVALRCSLRSQLRSLSRNQLESGSSVRRIVSVAQLPSPTPRPCPHAVCRE